MSISLDDHDYIRLIITLNHICKIQESILKINTVFFSPDTIDNKTNDFLSDEYLKMLKDSILKGDLKFFDDDDMGLDFLLDNILINQNYILLNKIWDIPKDFVRKDAPCADSLFKTRVKIVENLNRFAELSTKEVIVLIDELTKDIVD